MGCPSPTWSLLLHPFRFGFQEEIARDEYEIFDDYLEMVIQFGYVTLFASGMVDTFEWFQLQPMQHLACPVLFCFWRPPPAFPLAAILSIFCNVIELFSDLFKLTRVCRR